MPSIDSWLTSLKRNHQGTDDCPVWPPDLFAICGSLLKISGAYLRIFERDNRDAQWVDAHKPGSDWRERFDKMRRVSPASLGRAVPDAVRSQWDVIIASKSVAIGAIKRHAVADALIRLTLIADESSVGIGVSTESTPFLTTAQSMLESNELLSFTWDVPRDSVCALGKQHTPQRGATFRSLSHHLSLYWPNDIEGRWVGPYERGQEDKPADTVNLLLLPWPTEVDSADFHMAAPRKTNKNSRSHFFDYHPSGRATLAAFRKKMSTALDQARTHAKQVDAVVFPEAALSLNEYWEAEKLALKAKVMLIGGVRIPSRRGVPGLNLCAIQPTGLLLSPKGPGVRASRKLQQEMTERFRLMQSKHHRWCLDKEQILQYQLAGQVPPCDAVWENIGLPPRVLHFVTLGHWMTWSVLICEDLARQDPAADLIRSVGPNLLITLLMDGPQLRGRWPSRYASVLAEDPGTSVLTLTSLGMAERCRPTLRATGQRADKSRAIALWRDVDSGEQEIVLDPGHDACILTLVCKSRQEIAADGRGDGTQSHFPVYAGYRSFSASG